MQHVRKDDVVIIDDPQKPHVELTPEQLVKRKKWFDENFDTTETNNRNKFVTPKHQVFAATIEDSLSEAVQKSIVKHVKVERG